MKMRETRMKTTMAIPSYTYSIPETRHDARARLYHTETCRNERGSCGTGSGQTARVTADHDAGDTTGGRSQIGIWGSQHGRFPVLDNDKLQCGRGRSSGFNHLSPANSPAPV